MRPFSSRILLLAVAGILTVAAAEPPVLPTLSFYALNKQRITLPADLRGDRTLLLLYFDLTKQPEVDKWNAVIDGWRKSDDALTSYTSLVSPQKNFLSRWWQNASIRSASPDASHWATTLPIYVDKHAFEHELGLSSEKQVVVLLLDRKGHVVSRVSGPPSESNRNAILAALTTAGSPAEPPTVKPAPSR